MSTSTSGIPANLLALQYSQYKEDTESIASWLATTAEKCGHQVARPINTSTRLKGKARKQAKEKAAAFDGGSSKRSVPQYIIRVSDFVPMARTIVNKADKLEFQAPRALSRLFERAISARQDVNEWFSSVGGHDADSNDRHNYFIGVLRETFDTLYPFISRKKSTRHPPRHEEHGASAASLSNRFASLEVHDLDGPDHPPDSKTGESSETQAKDTMPRTAPVTILRDEGELLDELMFAVHFFLYEVAHLRQMVIRTWRSYFEGISSLIEASLVTNTAIHLVRQLEYKLGNTTERPEAFPEDKFPAWTLVPIANWISHYGLSGKVSLDDFTKVSGSVNRLDCAHKGVFLADVFFGLKAAVYQSSLHPHDELPDLGSSYMNLSDDLERVFSMLPDFRDASKVAVVFNQVDEITRGVHEMFTSRTVPMLIVFGIQLILDIEDVQRVAQQGGQPNSKKVPLHEAQRVASERLQHFSGVKLGSDFMPPTVLGAFKAKFHSDLWTTRSGLLGDFSTCYHCEAAAGEGSRAVTSPWQGVPNPYLAKNPVWCGMLEFDVHLRLHRIAFDLESAWFGLTGMVHLYVACRRLFPNDPIWPDMELMLRLLDVNHLFFGGLPTSMEEAFRKLRLAMGAVPSSMTRDSRSKSAKTDPKRARLVSHRSTLVDNFSPWSEGKLDSTAEHDKWVGDLRRAMRDKTGLQRAVSQITSSKDAQASWTKLALSMTTEELKSHEVLLALTLFLQWEAAALEFGWVGMHQVVEDMWSKISASTGERCEEVYTEVSDLVWDIFDEACAIEHLALQKRKDPSLLLVKGDSLLANAWEIMKKTFMTELGLQTCIYESRMVEGELVHTAGKHSRHIGDQEVTRLVARHHSDCFHPNANIELRNGYYSNWPEQKELPQRSVGNYYLYKAYQHRQAVQKSSDLLTTIEGGKPVAGDMVEAVGER